MIPQLNFETQPSQAYGLFLDALEQSPFSGEVRRDFSSRLVTSTDNSIYQILPQAVVFPKNTEDLETLLSLADQDCYKDLTFSPRGGGTGTNGQSLSPGVIIDCSKHMRGVLEVNEAEAWVRIQPGVILDQLNETLKPRGLFFAPNLSPANRATIGGMINTDACGMGSRVYGRTSNHVLELTLVLSNGQVHQCAPLEAEALGALKERDDRVGHIHTVVDEIVTGKKALIEEIFPKMSRFLTGYNLAKVRDESGRFDLAQIVCGSEGSLAMVAEAKLNLTPIPTFKGLAAVQYDSFNNALGDAQALLSTDPTAIETVDEKILEAAREDVIFHRIGKMIGTDPALKTINLVEYTAYDEDELLEKLAPFQGSPPENRLGCYVTRDPKEIAALWELRKKGVGLLGNLPGSRRPIAFIEDTAVPPEHLADYIAEFRALLEGYGLAFAMYGHVDVGCLHVRPSLDLQDEYDEQLVRRLSDDVVALVRKYGGIMWAEHGKGFRTEYTPLFFGEELYQDLRKIKSAFDPLNKLNPGKVVMPLGIEGDTVKIEAPLRGHFDRQIPENWQNHFSSAIHCNGNGACFNYNPHHVMCPSSKITLDRIHSPKGRAAMMREWLRSLASETGSAHQDSSEKSNALPIPRELVSKGGFLTRLFNTLRRKKQPDFSHEVYQAMAGCLSCKACATMCPIRVDVPDFKARFLTLYHTRYLRPLRDYFIGMLEPTLPLQARLPRLVNGIMGLKPVKSMLEPISGLTDAPKLSTPTVHWEMGRRGLKFSCPLDILALNESERRNSVVLVQDAFTTYYDAPVFWAVYNLLSGLGFQVHILPFMENGKPLHIKGFLHRFKRVAEKNWRTLASLGACGVPMVGVEPSMVLTYREEYPKILNKTEPEFKVFLVQEWLADKLSHIKAHPRRAVQNTESYVLMNHCMETTATVGSAQQWQQVFEAMGLKLDLVSSGCCGMAGTYGHETEHVQDSKGIFDLSWGVRMKDQPSDRFLATGYSCRAQTMRMLGYRPLHPAQLLMKHLISA